MKRSDGALGIGLISVFNVLVVLCLSVLAMLALTTARAELRLAQANADAAAAYYAADLQAHQLYAGFAGSQEQSLWEQNPISPRQSLLLGLEKRDGQVVVLSWCTVTEESGETAGPQLWDGDVSAMGGQEP